MDIPLELSDDFFNAKETRGFERMTRQEQHKTVVEFLMERGEPWGFSTEDLVNDYMNRL